MPSRFSTPRERSTSSVGAATENGTSSSACSRLVAVTVISSVNSGCSVNSSCGEPLAPTSITRVTVRNPGIDTMTL
jgi:hypothetical protein